MPRWRWPCGASRAESSDVGRPGVLRRRTVRIPPASDGGVPPAAAGRVPLRRVGRCRSAGCRSYGGGGHFPLGRLRPFRNVRPEVVMSFTDEEIAYMRSQPLARVATLSPDGRQPDVVPLAFEYDGTYFWVGGSGSSVAGTRKFRNIRGRPPRGGPRHRRSGVPRSVRRTRRPGLRHRRRARRACGDGRPGALYAHHADRLLELEHGGPTGGRGVVPVAPVGP